MKSVGSIFLFFSLAFILTAFVGKNAISEPLNLALNANDKPQKTWTEADGYPHATTNSEYPGDGSDPAFWALNAIDGKKENKGHGLAFPSWGPEKRADLWWKVDFGKTVEIQKLVIYIRADFTPYTQNDHDGYWSSARVLFSDGTSISIQFKRTADAQIFEFEPKNTSFIKITDLLEEGLPMWCAFTEVEAWGNIIK